MVKCVCVCRLAETHVQQLMIHDSIKLRPPAGIKHSPTTWTWRGWRVWGPGRRCTMSRALSHSWGSRWPSAAPAYKPRARPGQSASEAGSRKPAAQSGGNRCRQTGYFEPRVSSAGVDEWMNPLLWVFSLHSWTKTNADGRILHSFNGTVIVAVLLEDERQHLKHYFMRNCSGF